jgi:hypothetical protein
VGNINEECWMQLFMCLIKVILMRLQPGTQALYPSCSPLTAFATSRHADNSGCVWNAEVWSRTYQSVIEGTPVVRNGVQSCRIIEKYLEIGGTLQHLLWLSAYTYIKPTEDPSRTSQRATVYWGEWSWRQRGARQTRTSTVWRGEWLFQAWFTEQQNCRHKDEVILTSV